MEETYEIPYSGNPEFSAPADISINLKLVSQPGDDPDSPIFHPVFTHQIINQDERILGYKDPKVDLCFASDSLVPFLKFTYAEVDGSARPEEITDVIGCFTTREIPACKNGPLIAAQKLKTSVEEFNQEVSATSFAPPGDHFHSFAKMDAKQNITKNYEIYKVEIQRAPEYYRRVAIFGTFFIETAQFLDAEDPHWSLYTLYERRQMATGGTKLIFNGFCATYFHSVLPKFERIAISQFVILPPFQRQGLGTALLNAIYQDARSRQIHEVVVEDPTPEFQLMRNLADLRACAERGYFSKMPGPSELGVYKPKKRLLAGLTGLKQKGSEKSAAEIEMGPPTAAPKGKKRAGSGSGSTSKPSVHDGLVALDDRTIAFFKDKRKTSPSTTDAVFSSPSSASPDADGTTSPPPPTAAAAEGGVGVGVGAEIKSEFGGGSSETEMSGAESDQQQQKAEEISAAEFVVDPKLLIWETRILNAIRDDLKITKKQARMCYEVFKLMVARGYAWSEQTGWMKTGPESSEIYNQVRIDIKRRLFGEFLEVLETASQMEPGHRKRKLAELFAEEESRYSMLIDLFVKGSSAM